MVKCEGMDAMKKMIIRPTDWECTLKECPPGLFMRNGYLGFKTEYGPEIEVFNESGEVFWGGVKTKGDRDNVLVTPCESDWVFD